MISEDDARAWVAAYAEAWVNRDPDRVVELFTSDARYQERRFGNPLEGVEAIRTYWQTLVHELQREVAFELHQVAVTGDQAFLHWTAHFIWRPINGIVELDAVSRVTFAPETRNGLRLASGFEEWINSREA
jgi:uncharacterized protein (TIGR02246 family)